MGEEKRILIVGAGPTGLGAAWRLRELGHTDWLLCDAADHAGGLASSVVDEKGFTWDHGGHVIFSHYDYFTRLLDDLLGEDGWYHHQRESWVWIFDRFVPYPFQNNIRRLPREALWECLEGLLKRPRLDDGRRPENFEAFIDAFFGEGLARHFMMPYNFKVWACPPREMNAAWVGERVAPVDLERVLRNVILENDEVSWGPNSRFRFPKTGGTGSIWRALAERLSDQTLLSRRLVRFDTRRRVATFQDGTDVDYDAMISTVPLDRLVELSDRDDLRPAARKLVHSSTNIVGVGLRGRPPDRLRSKCWMYFPEDNCPFYRTTVFSNYSPAHVPDPGQTWSLMTETSESPRKPVDQATIAEEVVQGLLNTGLIESADDVVDLFHTRLEHGYPTPSVGRDAALDTLLPALDAVGIHSRGRFGAWKYEVANQDHSLMQGVEAAERILLGAEEQTVWRPDLVNGGGARTRSMELVSSGS
jgi:protoporphyrinogen oxidase